MLKRKKQKAFMPSKLGPNERAQSAVEYMLLFATVMVVVMYGFDTFFPFIRESSNQYYNGVVMGVTGKEPPNFCTMEHGGILGCP